MSIKAYMNLLFFATLLNTKSSALYFRVTVAYSENSWQDIGKKFQPGAVCSEGKEKLTGDPFMWNIYQPNAAVVYRVVRALEATGVLIKFSEYFQNRSNQWLDHFATLRLEQERRSYNLTENGNEQHSDANDFDGFTMKNIKFVFRACLILIVCGFCKFLYEFSTLFVEVSCSR